MLFQSILNKCEVKSDTINHQHIFLNFSSDGLWIPGSSLVVTNVCKEMTEAVINRVDWQEYLLNVSNELELFVGDDNNETVDDNGADNDGW